MPGIILLGVRSAYAGACIGFAGASFKLALDRFRAKKVEIVTGKVTRVSTI